MYHMYVCTARNRLVLPVVGGTRFGLKKFRTDGIRASWISVQVQLERETLARQQPDRCRGKKQSRSTLLRPVVGKNQDNSRYNWNLPCKRISIIPRHPLPCKPGTIDGNWMIAMHWRSCHANAGINHSEEKHLLPFANGQSSTKRKLLMFNINNDIIYLQIS